MFSQIMEFLTGTLGGNALIGSFLIAVVAIAGKSKAYKSIRESWGRACEAAGIGVSAIGNTWLKVLWDPIESMFLDFIAFGAEQFAVGLRKDNPAKLVAQLERLTEVDSKTRSAAIIEKIKSLPYVTDRPSLKPEQQAVFDRIQNEASESIESKLKD